MRLADGRGQVIRRTRWRSEALCSSRPPYRGTSGGSCSLQLASSIGRPQYPTLSFMRRTTLRSSPLPHPCGFFSPSYSPTDSRSLQHLVGLRHLDAWQPVTGNPPSHLSRSTSTSWPTLSGLLTLTPFASRVLRRSCHRPPPRPAFNGILYSRELILGCTYRVSPFNGLLLSLLSHGFSVFMEISLVFQLSTYEVRCLPRCSPPRSAS